MAILHGWTVILNAVPTRYNPGNFSFNSRYRILAVDHDLISFSDVTFNKWPVVVITNPKDAHYGIKAHEPLNRIRKSTHIR